MPPRRPKILDLFLTTATVVINGERWLESAPQVNMQARLWDGVTGSLIVDRNLGPQTTHAFIELSGTTLVEGRLYRAQIRSFDGTDFSAWSRNAAATVPKRFGLSRIPIPDEPEPPEAGGVIPIRPMVPLAEVRRFTFREWTMQTAHFMRRRRRDFDRRKVDLEWRGLTAAEKDALESFIDARLLADPPEAFTIDDADLAGRSYFPHKPSKTIQLDPRTNTWSMRLVCDETTPDPAVFTVGRSTIGGGHKIR